jgi:hypothetical protein
MYYSGSSQYASWRVRSCIQESLINMPITFEESDDLFAKCDEYEEIMLTTQHQSEFDEAKSKLVELAGRGICARRLVNILLHLGTAPRIEGKLKSTYN